MSRSLFRRSMLVDIGKQLTIKGVSGNDRDSLRYRISPFAVDQHPRWELCRYDMDARGLPQGVYFNTGARWFRLLTRRDRVAAHRSLAADRIKRQSPALNSSQQN